MSEEPFAALREQMVLEIAAHAALAGPETGREALDPRVMSAMGKVPRHEFVPLEVRPFAYLDRPLPIGFDKTISQPFIVALMTDLLQAGEGDVVLDVGTGLGYQAAVLAELGCTVYSMEMIEELARQAMARLARLGYHRVEVKVGNGRHGWPAHAPFDRIMVAAAPDLIPAALINQLRPGGRMVIPAGLPDAQTLMLVEKEASGRVRTRDILAVRFSELDGADSE